MKVLLIVLPLLSMAGAVGVTRFERWGQWCWLIASIGWTIINFSIGEVEQAMGCFIAIPSNMIALYEWTKIKAGEKASPKKAIIIAIAATVIYTCFLSGVGKLHLNWLWLLAICGLAGSFGVSYFQRWSQGLLFVLNLLWLGHNLTLGLLSLASVNLFFGILNFYGFRNWTKLQKNRG